MGRFWSRRVGVARHAVRFPAFPTYTPDRAADHGSVTRSVLIVDDDPEFRRLARRLLVGCGLTVIGESDGVSAALAAAERLRPSAFLVDVELPDGDGVGLARQLAGLAWSPRIVLTSVDGGIASAEEVRTAGAMAFVAKADLPNAPLGQLLGAA